MDEVKRKLAIIDKHLACGAGYFHKNGQGRGIQFIFWDFIDDTGDNFVTIEQWGESEFEASAGICVEEYQFTNILPGE